MKQQYEVHIRAVKARVPTKAGDVKMLKGEVVKNPIPELIEMAKKDKKNLVFALVPVKGKSGGSSLDSQVPEKSDEDETKTKEN